MTNKAQSGKIEDAIKKLRGSSESERLLHRLHSVVLVLNGYSASHAARIYGDSPRAVAYWVTRFNRMGMKGLSSEPRSGRPSSLDANQWKHLQTFVRRREAESKPVTAKTISQYIKRKFGVELTERHCFRILKRLKA